MDWKAGLALIFDTKNTEIATLVFEDMFFPNKLFPNTGNPKIKIGADGSCQGLT